MRLCYAVFFVASAGLSLGAPPADSPFTFPSDPPAPAPPAPKPGTVPLLTSDVFYVINAKTDAILRAHPADSVRVVKESGPIRIRGKFIDGTGKVETKTFPGPYVFIVEASGTGRVELDLIPLGLKLESEIVSKVIDVDDGTAPQPPPKPVPPDPKPINKADKVWVFVIEDATVPRTVETAKLLNDPFWLTVKPKHDWRHYRSDSEVAIKNGYVSTAVGTRENPGPGYPCVIITNAADGAILGKPFKSDGTIQQIENAMKEVAK